MRKAVDSFLVFLTVFFYPFREKCHETKQIVSNLLTIFVMCHLFFGRFKENDCETCAAFIYLRAVYSNYCAPQNVCFHFSVYSKQSTVRNLLSLNSSFNNVKENCGKNAMLYLLLVSTVYCTVYIHRKYFRSMLFILHSVFQSKVH